MCHTRSCQFECYCRPDPFRYNVQAKEKCQLHPWISLEKQLHVMHTKVRRVLCSNKSENQQASNRGQLRCAVSVNSHTERTVPRKGSQSRWLRNSQTTSVQGQENSTVRWGQQMALRPAARCTVSLYSPRRGAGRSFLTTSCVNELFNVYRFMKTRGRA